MKTMTLAGKIVDSYDVGLQCEAESSIDANIESFIEFDIPALDLDIRIAYLTDTSHVIIIYDYDSTVICNKFPPEIMAKIKKNKLINKEFDCGLGDYVKIDTSGDIFYRRKWSDVE